MLAYLISGVTYGFAAAVSPGPLSMYLMSQAVSKGWRKAMPVAFSPLITDGPVAVLVLAILSRVPSSLVSCLRVARRSADSISRIRGVEIVSAFFPGRFRNGRRRSEQPSQGRPHQLAESEFVYRLERDPGTDRTERMAQSTGKWSGNGRGILCNDRHSHGGNGPVVCSCEIVWPPGKEKLDRHVLHRPGGTGPVSAMAGPLCPDGRPVISQAFRHPNCANK